MSMMQFQVTRNCILGLLGKNSSTSLKLSQNEKIDFDLGFAISSFSTRLS